NRHRTDGRQEHAGLPAMENHRRSCRNVRRPVPCRIAVSCDVKSGKPGSRALPKTMHRSINSERSLQASLWARLNKILPRTNRRMFIELGLSISGTNHQVRYPDIVICHSRSVIGISELKYLPRTRPAWQKDIATFRWIVEN